MALGVLTGERREDVTGREPKGRAGVASLIAPPDRWLKANPARLLTGRRPVGAGHPRRTVRPTRSLRCILPAGPIWGDRMSRGKSPDGRRRSRIWLGPPGRGGERLSHLFEIEPARGRDFESRLDELRADVHRLERQVEELGHATLSADTAFEQSAPSGRDAGRPLRRTVDLRSGPPEIDRNYWLGHCEGFAVFIGGSRFGAIECIRFQTRLDRPDLLEVRCGRFGRQVLLIAIEEVDVVDPEKEAVILNASYRPLRVGQRLRSRLNQLWAPHHVGG
jgi:hypothetical protein